MKYRESQLHPFLCYWETLLTSLDADSFRETKERGIGREFFGCNWESRGNIVKLCADSLNKDGKP